MAYHARNSYYDNSQFAVNSQSVDIMSTKDLFKTNRWMWKIAGFISPKKYRIPYSIWTVILNVSVTFFFPFHLAMGLFETSNKQDIFENLSITFVTMQSFFKHLVIWWNLKMINHIQDVFTILDKSIRTKDEKVYFDQKIERRAKYVIYIFATLYTLIMITVEGSAFIGGARKLLYPGWLPFDWRNSFAKYCIANSYQSFAIFGQIIFNYANDTYPTVSLLALSGHVRLLAMRVSKLGADSERSRQDNNRDLRKCILDHKRLIEIYYGQSEVLSVGMFSQILGTGLNMCFAVIYLAFFADNLFAYIYYTTLFLGLPFQIFPSCYYGSVFELELENLQYALFACNWIDQDKEFKQNLIIFGQRNLQPSPFLCLDFFRIHLDSFFVAIRSAYSLSAVIIQTK